MKTPITKTAFLNEALSAGKIMAFDMYLGKERCSIKYNEERLFELASENEAYPKLSWIWEEYYNGPIIPPSLANELVHELISLRTKVSSTDKLKYLSSVIERLLPFFSKAYRMDEQIKCVSD